MHPFRKSSAPALLAVLLSLSACEGLIALPGTSGPGLPDNGGGALVSQCVSPDLIAPSERLTRLTNTQYGNMVRDLLGLTADIEGFAQDASAGGFSNNAYLLFPSDRLVRDWNRSAETLSEQAVTNTTALNRVAPCSGGQTQTCFNTFLDKMGLRLYRRPLSASQKTKLATAWAAAGPLYTAGTQYEKAVRMALEAMLQSPAFLYRAELSETPDAKGGFPLSNYEVAERLAFALWSSAPDDALLAAAQQNQLTALSGVQLQARRLIADTRARGVMRDFYYQWLTLSAELNLMRSASFTNFNTALGPSLPEETERFLESVTFDTSGSFKDLYTAPYTFVDGPLAKLYGISGVTGSTFQRVDLDPRQRSGLLTQVGFLATQAYADIDSPIHRGAFVIKRLMCADFSPPGGINVVLPPVSNALKTTRQRVAAHTSAASCNVCHGAINPVGFAFEHYDAVGQWRELDNGVPVDSHGALPTATSVPKISKTMPPLESTEVDGAVELQAAMATHPTAQKCFSAMWLRYLYNRLDYPQDACQVEALQKKLAEPSYQLKDMLVDLVSSRAFTTRGEVTQ